MKTSKTLLIILDGWGHGDKSKSDIIYSTQIHIKSLEKLSKQDFAHEQQILIKNMLINKIRIYANGAKKRGRIKTYNKFIKRIDELSYKAWVYWIAYKISI